MGFNNIKPRYNNRFKKFFNAFKSSFSNVEIFRFFKESFFLFKDIINNILDYPFKFLKITYFYGGLFFAILLYAKSFKFLSHYFSFETFFELLIKIIITALLWIFDSIKIIQIYWIAFVAGAFVAHYFLEQKVVYYSKTFKIWSTVIALIYAFYFFKIIV